MTPALKFAVAWLAVFAVVDYLFYVGVLPGGSVTQGVNALTRRWLLPSSTGCAVVMVWVWRHCGLWWPW